MPQFMINPGAATGDPVPPPSEPPSGGVRGVAADSQGEQATGSSVVSQGISNLFLESNHPIKTQVIHLATFLESPHPYHVPLARGLIYQRRPIGFSVVSSDEPGGTPSLEEGTSSDRYRRGLKFMFNPSTFDYNYEVNATDVISVAQQSPEELQNSFFPTGRTFALQLLFDRQLEVTSSDSNYLSQAIEPARPMREVGVWEDIRAMERLIGILHDNDFPQTFTPVTVLLSSALQFGLYTGVAFSVPAMRPIPALIMGASVQITDWAAGGYVPTRCVINMQFQHWYIPPNNANFGGATTGTVLDIVTNAAGTGSTNQPGDIVDIVTGTLPPDSAHAHGSYG